ncbi:MAG: helix-turn-helix domain-containing protein [Asgard group archaeon]|nr:helix-turn-helix domain-containing protein [Asgard group archaeon]
MSKKLLTETDDGSFTKKIRMFKQSEKMKAILNKTRWKILQRLSEEPKFPAELAREMGIHDQKIYYHIRQLINAGLVEVAYEQEIRGAIARFYSTKEKVFCIELDPDEKGLPYITSQVPLEKPRLFFQEFFKDNAFDGLIVVGAPDPHGPHKTWARDGHYAIHLAMFLGQFVPFPKNMFVKLDVEVRAAKAHDQNLILIGGPAVNLVTQDINSKLPIPHFDNQMKGIAPDATFGRGINSYKSNIFYSQNNAGIIFKEPNPYNPDKTIIAFSGQGRRGTIATILALTENWTTILKDYESGPLRVVVEGYDQDGDGTIDSVEILE